MSTPLVTQKKHLQNSELYGASEGRLVNYVSPNDVADVAAHVLVDPESHARVGYNLCGPALTDQQVADVLGKAPLKHIQFKNVFLLEYAKEEENKEYEPDFIVDDLVSFEHMKASGIEADFKSKDIETICGHPAESFADYLKAKNLMSNLEMVA